MCQEAGPDIQTHLSAHIDPFPSPERIANLRLGAFFAQPNGHP